ALHPGHKWCLLKSRRPAAASIEESAAFAGSLLVGWLERRLHEHAEQDRPGPGLQVLFGLETSHDFVPDRQLQGAAAARALEIGVENLADRQLHLVDPREFELELFALDRKSTRLNS